MISSKAKNPNCMYMWMDHIISPEGQRGRRGVVRRGPVEPEGVRGDRGQGPLRHLPRGGRGLLLAGRLLDDADARTAATTGARSARTTPSGSRRGPRSRGRWPPPPPLRHRGSRPGAPGRLPLAPPRAAARAAAGRPDRLAGDRLPRLARRAVRGRASGTSTRSRARSSAASASTTSARWSRRTSTARSCCGRSLIAAAVTVTDALLAFPIAFFMAKVASAAHARAARDRGRDAAVVVVPGEGLRVADHPRRGRDPELGARPVRRSAGPGFGNVATWLVFSYLWLPYMILPVYAGAGADPGLAAGRLGRPRRRRRRRRSGAWSCRSRCRAWWPARSSRSR